MPSRQLRAWWPHPIFPQQRKGRTEAACVAVPVHVLGAALGARASLGHLELPVVADSVTHLSHVCWEVGSELLNRVCHRIHKPPPERESLRKSKGSDHELVSTPRSRRRVSLHLLRSVFTFR